MKRPIFIIFFSLLAFFATADQLKIKANSPTDYVVVKGDTLWDISAKFLKSPWRWPEIWGYNNQIADPHWIYPGDIISLIYVDGKPKLVIKKAKQQLRMSPHGRLANKRQPIPTVALSDISQYLTHQQVVSSSQLKALPLVVGSERNTLFYKVGDIIYTNKELPVGSQFGIYHHERSFNSKVNRELLGHELELTAIARVTKSAKISRLELLSVNNRVSDGQVVMELANNDTLPVYFLPKPAPEQLMATVLASGNRYRDIGKNNVVIIDAGTEQGINEGSVFSVYRPGVIQVIDQDNRVRNPFSLRRYDKIKSYFVGNNSLELPDVYRGKLMVFRSFDKVSYAIITELARPIRVDDELINP